MLNNLLLTLTRGILISGVQSLMQDSIFARSRNKGSLYILWVVSRHGDGEQ